jgi:hypothetical protein
VDPLAVEREGRAEQPVGESDRPLKNGVEHGLHVRRRARDNSQDLGGGRLLLQRLFCLLEQADVVDGDHRLGGEGLEERNLPVGERPYVGPPDGDRPDGLGPAEQRYVEHRPETVRPG